MTFRRIFAIGDVHGDDIGLQQVVQRMQVAGMDLTQDLLVQLGDLVDGAPYVKETVTYMKGLQEEFPENVVVLYGNHEDLMIRALEGSDYSPAFDTWWYQGGRQTFESYRRAYDTPAATKQDVRSTIDANHLLWLGSRPYSYETDDHIFVHAGLRPHLSLAEQSTHDLLWIRDDFITSDYDFGKLVVFGHTPVPEPLIMSNKLGIDTRHRKGGYITGVEFVAPRAYRFFRSDS